MSADVVIRADNLGKKYLIGRQSSDRANTLRDAIVRSTGNFARDLKQIMRGNPIIAGDEIEEFWALRDVSFEIRRGDVVGVIGRNGAGKSTLLKVLSRITEPSEGRVEIGGRVASLLEVGTGFHPELTGRENIYLNGAILGMGRSEIKRKFDEIVAFAEIEKFLDTPVKRYSSGMYVRLAFAVAAHLEPEILIVDEVLAVGDAEFQRKCLGKMKDVAGHGRTVLFVSHNVSAVTALCSSCLWLVDGGRREMGPTQEILSAYINHQRTSDHSATLTSDWASALADISMDDERQELVYTVKLDVRARSKIRDFHIFFQTSTGHRAAIIDLMSRHTSEHLLEAGSYTFNTRVSLSCLNSDLYTLGLHIAGTHGAMTDWSVATIHVTNPATRYPIQYQGPLSLANDRRLGL